jgi:hypothetical protein
MHIVVMRRYLGRPALNERATPLDGLRAVLGERHPDTLITSSVLAVVYRNMGRLSDADAAASDESG